MDYYREQIKENIDYDLLQRDYPHRMERIDGYVELMAETCCTGKETVRVNGENMPAAVVWDRLLKLDREHICYIRDPRKICVIDVPRQYEKRQPGQEWKQTFKT